MRTLVRVGIGRADHVPVGLFVDQLDLPKRRVERLGFLGHVVALGLVGEDRRPLGLPRDRIGAIVEDRLHDRDGARLVRRLVSRAGLALHVRDRPDREGPGQAIGLGLAQGHRVGHPLIELRIGARAQILDALTADAAGGDQQQPVGLLLAPQMGQLQRA